jgi:A/G-specific adenine glycosylase
MQQTRIEQGAPYYLSFINRFPTVQDLASASADEVLRYWQGLGYYTRARNLHKAARFITDELKGEFPRTYDGLIRLPGIGPYSAAAIASFAYGHPHPVVDGNVKRVISRFSGITSSIDDPVVHEQIRQGVSGFMKGVAPGEFNQAIMNFGAIVCKPKNPVCDTCPLSAKCYALQHSMVGDLPVRTKKKSNILRHFHFMVIHWNGKILLHQRGAKDIWHSLYTPPLLERNSPRAPAAAQFVAFVKDLVGHSSLEVISSSPPQQQLLSHQTIIGRFHHIRLLSAPKGKAEHHIWVTPQAIQDLARPKMIVQMTDQLF